MRTGAALRHEDRGVIELRGEETADFLQRLSTNEMSPLREGGWVYSVLTTEKGRVVDLCAFIPSDGAILAVTSAGRAPEVKAWLEKFIIMEDITVTDVSSSMTSYSVIGPKAESFLSSIDGFAGELSDSTPRRLHIGDGRFLLLRDPAIKIPDRKSVV